MPPSASENVRFGNFCSAPLNSRSTVVHIRFEENRIVGMTNGAIFDSEAAAISLAVGLSAMNEKPGTNEPDPKCSDTGVSVSAHRAHRGAQWSVWNDGRPSGTGESGNEIVRAPFSMARLASATVRSMSQTGRIPRGMNRGGGAPDAPAGQDPLRDEPVGRGPAPLVDVEVVPRLHAQRGELLVVGAEERAPAEAGERREAERRLLAVQVHVLHPRGGVVAAGDHVLVADRVQAPLLAWLARDGIEPDGREDLAVVVPQVHTVDFLDPRRLVAELSGYAVLPHARVLDEVVIDGHDLVMLLQRHL